jgi:hypothetical protein
MIRGGTAVLALINVLLFAACDTAYGKLGGADQTETYRSNRADKEALAVFESIMSPMSGVWYSHYAGIGRLDGYRIGKWKDFDAIVGTKIALFPNLERITYTEETGNDTPDPEDYFLLYDDTVYGQADDNAPGHASWGFAYCGIVRAVNVFNYRDTNGAIIIEYLKGGAPLWLNRWPESSNGKRPFFGIYYRVLDPDIVQMANAVDLAALYAGKNYYTEQSTLEEALDLNNVENEAEFISWGVVIPQDREPR